MERRQRPGGSDFEERAVVAVCSPRLGGAIETAVTALRQASRRTAAPGIIERKQTGQSAFGSNAEDRAKANLTYPLVSRAAFGRGAVKIAVADLDQSRHGPAAIGAVEGKERSEQAFGRNLE